MEKRWWAHIPQMVRSHEIRDRIHVSEQSMDFDGLADDRQAIENKWIFKKKTDADGNVTVYKARLVEKRFLTKFKVLNTMRFPHSYQCLKVCPNHVSNCHIL